MEAGIEHLGRGTCKNMDALIIVVEPGLKSIQTALTIKKMSRDIGIKKLFVVINKLKKDSEEKLIKENLEDFVILGKLPYSEKVRESDLGSSSPFDVDSEFRKSIGKITTRLEKFIGKK
jgi:CO dehydrogenase maturation factor